MSTEIQSATKNLDYVVHKVMADLRETNTKNYPFYLNWAFDGYQDMNLYANPKIVTKWINISGTNTICLPSDYVDYISIGINICGRLYLLGLNNNMVLNRKDECEVPIETIATKSPNITGEGIWPFYYFFSGAFRGGQYVGEQYAMGGGWSSRGYYKIDPERKEIQFQSVVPRSEIILEYRSTGIDCDGTVEVPYAAVPAIKAFIHWQRIENNDKESLADKRGKERLYGIEFNNFRKLKQRFTIQEYLDAKYRVSTAGPSR